MQLTNNSWARVSDSGILTRRVWILPLSTRSSHTAQAYSNSTSLPGDDNLLLIIHAKEKNRLTRSGAIEIQSPTLPQKLAPQNGALEAHPRFICPVEIIYRVKDGGFLRNNAQNGCDHPKVRLLMWTRASPLGTVADSFGQCWHICAACIYGWIKYLKRTGEMSRGASGEQGEGRP